MNGGKPRPADRAQACPGITIAAAVAPLEAEPGPNLVSLTAETGMDGGGWITKVRHGNGMILTEAPALPAPIARPPEGGAEGVSLPVARAGDRFFAEIVAWIAQRSHR